MASCERPPTIHETGKEHKGREMATRTLLEIGTATCPSYIRNGYDRSSTEPHGFLSNLGASTRDWLPSPLAFRYRFDDTSGRITTTARAPRSMPLLVKEVEKNFSNRVMCVKPFVAEFSTLATIWQRVLPFGLLTAHSRLPKIEDIKEFEVTFSDPRGDNFLSLNAAIVLFDTSSGKGFQAKAAKNLRPWLLDDEKGDMTVEAKKIRDGCIHDLSTFSWDSKGNKSSFWLRKDVIGSIKESGTWKIFLWRTDTWERVSDVVSIDKIKEGKSWV